MITHKASPLRSAIFTSPSHLVYSTRTTAAPTASVTRHLHSLTQRTHANRPSKAPIQRGPKQPYHRVIRRSSSSAPSALSSSSTTPSTQTTTTTIPTADPLTWTQYLPLRRTRRRYNQIASLFTSLTTTIGGLTYIQTLPLESAQIFGLDPVITLGLAVMGSGGLGWLLGPFLGEGVYGIRYRKLRGGMDEVCPTFPFV